MCGAALSTAWASSSAKWRRGAVQVSGAQVLASDVTPTLVGCGDAVVKNKRRGPSALEGLIQWGDGRG